MRNFVYSFLLLVVLCTGCVEATADQCEASTVGTNFIVGIIGYVSQPSGTAIHLHVSTTGYTPAHVRVTAPFVNFDNSYTVSNYTVIPLTRTLIQFEAGTQLKGIEVNSDVNISLTVVTGDYVDLMEGFLALPVNALGTRYIAASYYPMSSYSSEILVAGVASNTDVILSTMLNGQMGSNITFRLQKFETYQFKSNNDVSGSIITSTKPVAVFSGSAGSYIPVGKGDWQYMAEQIIPAKYWASKFIIPPNYPREHFVLKFFSDHDSTELHHYNSSKHVVKYMDKGSVEEVLFGTEPVVIVANNPISVIQYGHDGDNMPGDPFMLTAQGVSNFHDSYQFGTQNIFSTGSNTIAITVRKTDTSELRLNGHPMSFWNAKNISVAHPMEEYVTLFVNVSYNSYFRLHHNSGMQFGAVLYGRLSTATAYGYPLKMSFTDPECQYPTTISSTTLESTQTAVVTTHSSPTSNNGNGTLCFQCDGMTSLQYCDQVQRCQHENEVCYVERYPRSLTLHLYRSGCINSEQCNSRTGGSDCLECCSGDFCNMAGCGDKGFPAVGQRGPICFDCTHKGEKEDCSTVQLCHSNHACMVAKYEWGDNNFHYIMGCAESGACSAKRSVTSRRHAPVCTNCCHADFCNMNCTSDNTIPAIVVETYPPTFDSEISDTRKDGQGTAGSESVE